MNMPYNPEIHHRRSIRLQNYDYNQAGAYFVTIVAQNRKLLFGNIKNDCMELNQYGEIIKRIWEYLPIHFPNIEIDSAVIMPNHFHGIITITDYGSPVSKPNPKLNFSPNQTPFYLKKTLLGKTMAYFKYQATKDINKIKNTIGMKRLQTNYYEHIIRNDKQLTILREYIVNNPLNWESDQLHPDNPSKW